MIIVYHSEKVSGLDLVKNWIKRIIFSPKNKKCIKTGSIKLVYKNLLKSFKKLNVEFEENIPFSRIKKDDRLIVLGNGRHVLDKFNKPNKIIAGIGLMTHPSEWQQLFKEFPVAVYLQHSEWTANIYRRIYGEKQCMIWPAGIDVRYWSSKSLGSDAQILIYVKFLWDKEENEKKLLWPILRFLNDHSLPFTILRYGSYHPENYKTELSGSSAMIFLCEHESQGLAYQEAMSMNVPIYAWDQGFWLDPKRFQWGETDPVVATSVPYFDERCGQTFRNIQQFEGEFLQFWKAVSDNKFSPRNYVLENLTLEKSGQRMLQILDEVYS